MGLGDRVAGVVAFLRARYPSAAPSLGYAPLLALLPRRVSEDELSTITTALGGRGGRAVDRSDVRVDIAVEITRVIHELPSLDDIARVRDRLAAEASDAG